ncbi:hypothetical protein IGS67_04330 [Flavimobilis sp. GY10621]|uniref:PH domain-containing protein n=1 Tax=Flavimobilis rhizosphaerae TaxID=2775421 RepID=A0ABR9DS01_9MICO|nr:hypothetical protein [Flavimobilis rhizosphaerae]MBD9698725.1 hypothetical protein [Flavimobilis rhizosphaerae]
MRSAYAQIPPVPRLLWHLLGPAIGTAVITAAGIALESSDGLPAPVVSPPVLELTSVIEILAIVAATVWPLILAWQRPVGAAVLQAVAAVVLVLVSSIASGGLAGPAVALALAVGFRTAHRARAQALATWPRTPQPSLDDAARRAIDHGTKPARRPAIFARVLGAGFIILGLVWTGVDMARVHAFRSDPATVTTTGTVLELFDDDLYATLDVDGTPLTVEILGAPPGIGAELPVRANIARDRAELLGTPFDPAGALFWCGIGAALLVALRLRARDGHALATAARGPGAACTLVHNDDATWVEAPDGRVIAEVENLTLLTDPATPDDIDLESDPVIAAMIAEAEDLQARHESLSERARELSNDELTELWKAEARLGEIENDLANALDPRLAALVADGARTAVVLHSVPVMSEVVLRAPDALLLGTLRAPSRSLTAASVVNGRDDHSGDRNGRSLGPLATAARWFADHDALPMLAVHAAAAVLMWWLLDEPGNGWWETLRPAVFPLLLVHVTWLVQPAAGVRRTHLVFRELLRVQPVPWREITEITAHDGTVIVRTRSGGEDDAFVLGADPSLPIPSIAGCRTAEETAARLQAAWAAGRVLAPPAPRWLPSMPLLLACAWVALLGASVLA